MKDNTFQDHRRGEEGGELSQAEWPREKGHQSEVGDIFKEKIEAALNSADEIRRIYQHWFWLCVRKGW